MIDIHTAGRWNELAMPDSTKKRDSRPVIRRSNLLLCLFFVIGAAVMAFPQLIGSNDEPAYALVITFLAFAVLFGIVDSARASDAQRSKDTEVMEDGAGRDTLDDS